MPNMLYHPLMLVTLMECWNVDTSSFHLLSREKVVMLEVVYKIIDLPSVYGGWPMTR